MAKAVLDELARPAPRRSFTVGIVDDVSRSSLPVDADFATEGEGVRALFFGLGSDGTVGAAKSSVQIIGEETELHAQGYFVYDSKKSGAITVSHVRFGPQPIRSTYQIARAEFVACHQFGLLERIDVLERAAPGARVLLNSPILPSACGTPFRARSRSRSSRSASSSSSSRPTGWRARSAWAVASTR